MGLESDTSSTGTAQEAARRRTPLHALMAAETISMLGDRMAGIAVPWLVLVNTGSPTRMGTVGAALAVASVLASMFGAPLVDRFGMRRISVVTDLVSAAAMVVLASGHYGGFPGLLGVVAVTGAMSGVGVRAKRVLLGPVAGPSGTPMARVTAVYDGLNRTATLVGTSLGGILIAWGSAAQVLWIDAVTYVFCAAVVATLVRLAVPGTDVPDGADATGAAREPYFQALRAGFAHVRRDGIISNLVLVLFVTNLVNQASSSVLMPLWAHDVMGSPVALGLASAFFAGGAIAGNIAFAAVATRLPRYSTLAVAYLVGGLPRFLVLLFSDDLAVVLVVLAVAGFAISAVNPIYGTLLYERTPRPLQARVFGVTGSITTGGMPLGGLLGGWTVAGLGLSGGIALAGGVYFLATLIPVARWRTWQALDPGPMRGRSPAPGSAKEPEPGAATAKS